MQSKTIADGLGKYGIGPKLRRLRLQKSMGLVELSRHTGLSPALLSKLERGLMHPTLPTLLRIPLVFSVGLDYFFTSEPRPILEIVRRQDRLRFPEGANLRDVSYYFESLDFPVPQPRMNCYLAEFEPSPGKRVHEHPGVEFLYVLTGKVELSISGERHELAEGDAIYFDSSVPHSYRRSGAKRSTAVVVTVGESRNS